MTTGKFKDPLNPAFRLYGEVLSTHRGEHFVKVTRRNARAIEPFNTIVKDSEFTLLSGEFVTDSGANKGYWREQLRGKDGRFIEMGGGIEWIDAEGNRRLGTVDGFDDEIERVIVKDSEGNEYKLSADEIKQSAVKAVISDDAVEGEPAPETPGDSAPASDEEGLTEMDLFLGSQQIDSIDDFFDESKFPVGGEPLDIKDKQGNPLAQVRKLPDEDSPQGFSILFVLLAAILPHQLMRQLFGNQNRR